MTDEQLRELMEEIDYLEGAAHLPPSERTQALRCLVLKVGEWQKRANIVELELFRDSETQGAYELAVDIRDFDPFDATEEGE